MPNGNLAVFNVGQSVQRDVGFDDVVAFKCGLTLLGEMLGVYGNEFVANSRIGFAVRGGLPRIYDDGLLVGNRHVFNATVGREKQRVVVVFRRKEIISFDDDGRLSVK